MRPCAARGTVRPVRFGRSLRHVTWLVLSVSACGAFEDMSGFEQLAGKAPRDIDLPGVDLGEVGNFIPTRALGRDGSLVAIAGVTDRGKVRVVRADGQGSCTATTLPEGAHPGRHVPAALEDLLVVLDDRNAEGRGTLHVYDSECREVRSPLPSARPVAGSERLVPFRLLLERESDLVALDVNTRALEVVDRDVSFVTVTGEHVVTVSGGELVWRDFALDGVARQGSAVSEVVLVAGGKTAFQDDGRLRLVDSPGGKAVTLEPDACGIALADGPTRPGSGGARYLSYFAPCAASNLVVYDHVAERRYELGTALASRAVVHTVDDQAVAFFSAASSDDAAEGSLWVRFGADPPLEIGPGELAGVGLLVDGEISIWPGPREGPLLRWSKNGISPVRNSVVAFEARSYPERALLADGRLLQLEGVARSRELATGATSVGRGTATASIVFANVEDQVASLRLLRADHGVVEPVADGVYVPSASFWFTGQSLFYHADFDVATASGDLCMRLVQSGDTYCEPDVREFGVMIRPERGVALTKRVGGQLRLFWAEVH